MFPQIVDCDKWSIIIINEDLMNYTTEQDLPGIYRDKIFYIRRWYNIISKDKSTCSDPEFKSINHLKMGNKSYYYLYNN